MKKTAISTLLVVNLAFGSGIPVVDMAAITANAVEWGKAALQWGKELKHFKSQLDSYKKELETKTGIRDSIQFIKDIQEFKRFAKRYGKDFTQIGMDILNDNSILSQRIRSIYNKYNVFDECLGKEFLEKSLCENRVARKAQELVVFDEYADQIESISNDVQDLTIKLAKSKDIKESNDINNAIAAKMAQFKLAKSQIELINAKNERIDRLEREQRRKLFLKRLNTKQTVDLSNYIVR